MGSLPHSSGFTHLLTVPGDVIPSHVRTHSDFARHFRQLREQVRSLVPIPTSQHGKVAASIPRNLQQARYVFIRRDVNRTPLQRPYEGQFKVIQPGPKTFIATMVEKMITFQSTDSSLRPWIWSSQLKWQSPDDAGDSPLNNKLTKQFISHLSHCTHAQDVESSQHNGTSRFWRGVV